MPSGSRNLKGLLVVAPKSRCQLRIAVPAREMKENLALLNCKSRARLFGISATAVFSRDFVEEGSFGVGEAFDAVAGDFFEDSVHFEIFALVRRQVRGTKDAFGFSREERGDREEEGVEPEVTKQQACADKHDEEDAQVVANAFRIERGGDEKAYDGTAQVGVMADTTTIVLLHSKKGIEHITNRVEPGGNADGQIKHSNTAAGEQKNVCENYPANSARRAISEVIMMTMNKEREEIATNNRAAVNQQKLCRAQLKLHARTKKIKAQHIQDEMIPARVEEAGGDEAIIFFSGENAGGMKDEPFFKVAIFEREERPEAGGDYQEGGDGDGRLVHVAKVLKE